MDRWIWLQIRAARRATGTRRLQAWQAAIARCACCRTVAWHRRQPPLLLQRHKYARLHRHGLHLPHP